MKIDYINLKESNSKVKDNILSKISDVIDSSIFINSKYQEEFESNFSDWLRSLSNPYPLWNYVIGVSSGTAALEVALRCLDIGPGDEVISSTMGWVVDASVVLSVGAQPVFCDVEPETLNIDPEQVEIKITEKTKAIIAIHLYGNVCDLKNLNRFGIPVIEDCSHAHGSTHDGHSVGVGRGNQISIFSCYPTKTFGAMGEAGIIATTRKDYEIKIRSIINQGKPNFDNFPMNARMSVFQAIVLNEKLKYLNDDIEKRRKIMKIYDDNLSFDIFNQIKSFNRVGCSPHLYTIAPKDPQRYRNVLKKENIGFATYYNFSLHELEFCKKYYKSDHQYSVTMEMKDRVISLPLYPSMDIFDVYKVCVALNKEAYGEANREELLSKI